MNADLIRYAREHSYHRAEGFTTRDQEVSAAVNGAMEQNPELLAAINEQAAELAQAAGVPIETAESALLNWLLESGINEELKKFNN